MRINVLLVDDEKDFLESLCRRLQFHGFHVKTASNGDEALELIKGNEFDVVMLDMVMPGKDGIETLKEIKKIAPLLQAIMLTGHATVETAIEGMKLGAYDYLMKPTEIEDLVAKISKAYALKREHQKRILNAEIDHNVKIRG